MANEPFMDRWTLNGTEVLLQDHGRDEANGVPVLDGDAKLPTSYLPQNYANWLKVDPRDPYNMSFAEWLSILSSNAYRNRGTQWSKISEQALYCGVYVNGLYVYTSSRGIFWSEDGVTLNSSNVTTACGNILYANGLFLACGKSNSVASYWSEDGKNWTAITLSGAGYTGGACVVAYLNNVWFLRIRATSTNCVWAYSTNGKTFTVITSIGTFSGATSEENDTLPIYNNGVYLFACGASGIYWSENLTSFTRSSTIVAIKLASNGTVTLTGNQNALAKSTDNGKTWTFIHSQAGDNIANPAHLLWYSETKHVFVAITGGLAEGAASRSGFSADGEHWTIMNYTGGSNFFYGPIEKDSVFLVNSSSNTPSATSDIQWTKDFIVWNTAHVIDVNVSGFLMDVPNAIFLLNTRGVFKTDFPVIWLPPED